MARSATTSQCDRGTAFFSAIAAQVCSTRARVNADTSCTRSTRRSRKPCFARSSGVEASDVDRSRSSVNDPEEASEHTRWPSTVTSADRSEYASPSRCGSNSEMLVMVVLGMRCASSATKTPTALTPLASESCWRLYSAGSTDATSRRSAAARRAFSKRSAATAAHSAMGPGRCSCLFSRCTSAVVTFSSWPHLSAHAPSMLNAAPLVILLRSAGCDSSARHPSLVNRPRNASEGCLGRNRFHRSASSTPAMTCITRSRCSSHFHSTRGAPLVFFAAFLSALPAPGADVAAATPAVARASASATSAMWCTRHAYALSASRCDATTSVASAASPAPEASSEATEAESTERLLQSASVMRMRPMGLSAAKSRAHAYARSNTSCSNTHSASFSHKSYAVCSTRSFASASLMPATSTCALGPSAPSR